MLRQLLVLSAAGSVATGIAPAPASPFIGEWTLVPAKSSMPDEMKVESKGGNKYAFDFGGGVEPITVDGSYQPGIGGTLLSVQEDAPDTWVVKRKQGGRDMLSATWKLSRDGKTLTDYYRGFNPDGSTLSVDYVYDRVSGGLGFAADWRSDRATINSAFSMTVKDYQGAGLSITHPLIPGTRNMKFVRADDPNGGAAPAHGGASSLRQTGERTMVITDTNDGKTVATEDFALSNDLKTVTLTVHVTGSDRPIVLVFERQ